MKNLAYGPSILAIPGPTNIPDVVLQAMHRPAIDIYSGELEEITGSLLEDLKTLFRAPSGHPFIYVANGHGGWEGAIANIFSRGEKALVLESGRFAVGWGEMAEAMEGFDMFVSGSGHVGLTNQTGHPAAVLAYDFGIRNPDAESPTEMPLTTTLVGDLFADDKILSVASAFQRQTDWHRRRPPTG